MSRAVFLSSCGDPFIALLAMKLWKERWYNEVDRFYVNFNNHVAVPIEVAQEFCATVVKDPKVHLIYHPTGIGNGMPITEMALIAKEDNIMLLEDDGFIFESSRVAACFQKIESDLTDMLGSPRGSCGQEIWDASKEKYHLDYSGYGDVGPNFWPNFFFCKRKDLLRIDMNFGSITFQPGQYCKELDYTFKEINHGDTFVWACMQLRALGLRSLNIPQYHADPNEIENKRSELQNWFNTKPYWIHGGSLSSGWGGYLTGQLPSLATDQEKTEIETRVAFWTIAADNAPGFGFDSFKARYKAGIEDLTAKGSLNRDRIEQKLKIYKELLRL